MLKTIADNLPKADSVLRELLEFEQVAKVLAENAQPYSTGAQGRTAPRFVSETAVALKQNLVKDFSVSFSHIEEIVVNGQSSINSFGRLNDACYNFNEAQQAIYKANCVLMDDKVRAAITDKLRTVVADLVVFICIQFNLYEKSGDSVMLSVQKHCERVEMSPSELYELLIQDMLDVGRSWYAYEVISPYYVPLMEFDPVFVSECEENFYPLTDEMAERLIHGEIDVAYARGRLAEHMKGQIEREVDVSATNLISRMKLK